MSKWIVSIIFLSLAGLPAFADTSICDGIAGNLVSNCGFETGDFTSWTRGGNLGGTSVTNVAVYVNSGAFGGQLGPAGTDGTLTQIITDPGGLLELRFWLHNDANSGPMGPTGPNQLAALFNDFEVLWNGASVFALADVGEIAYAEHIIAVPGTGSDTLEFHFRNDLAFWGLDDISVTANNVPEPSSIVLLATVAAAAAWLARRRFRAA